MESPKKKRRRSPVHPNARWKVARHLAGELGVGIQNLEKMVKEGLIPAIKTNRGNFINVDQAHEAMLKEADRQRAERQQNHLKTANTERKRYVT